jgi:hypothetical protein
MEAEIGDLGRVDRAAFQIVVVPAAMEAEVGLSGVLK